jgi:hypothetical protein
LNDLTAGALSTYQGTEGLESETISESPATRRFNGFVWFLNDGVANVRAASGDSWRKPPTQELHLPPPAGSRLCKSTACRQQIGLGAA